MGRKGRNFEIAIAAQLSKWWSRGKRDDIFWHTSMSGGRAKIRSKVGKRTEGHYGDILASDPSGKPLIDLITIELKKGYNARSPFDAMDCAPRGRAKKPGRQQFEKFIDQVRIDAHLARTPYWMIIWKRDFRDAMVFIPKRLARALWPHIALMTPQMKMTTKMDGLQVLAVRLEDFLLHIDSEMIRNLPNTITHTVTSIMRKR